MNKSNPLDELTLSYSCPVDWDSMTGNDQERFCNQCSKKVFNISELSTAEANEFLRQKSASSTCVKFYRRADGTIKTDNCPRALRPVRKSAKLLKNCISVVGGFILLTLTTVFPTLAKPKPTPYIGVDPFGAPASSSTAAQLPVAAPISMGKICPMYKIDTGFFKSKDKQIRAQTYIPDAKSGKKYPVVLIFHGAGGLGDDDGNGFFQDVAKSLVLQKKIAIVVHYMDQSGIKSANREQMGKHFSAWLGTVKNAIDYAKTIPGADQNSICLLGHSLGAQLALHAAANRSDVKSVAVMAGCFVLPTNSVKSMPPVLILQGTADKTVTMAREKKLIQTLKSLNCKYEEHLLKNVDHSFNQIEYEKLIELINKFISKN
ncbi:MAG: dienelactone hydrolase family protein [Candidatus Melainabacteria bacterium]|nr:MAG: dienelactone hydrolase family protein [Candidatus Melainabacteria bacterium]